MWENIKKSRKTSKYRWLGGSNAAIKRVPIYWFIEDDIIRGFTRSDDVRKSDKIIANIHLKLNTIDRVNIQ